MSYQLDPKNFMFGTAFREGIQQSQDNKRKNALLDLEKQQFGLNERRVNAEEARLAQSDAERQAQMQAAQRNESIGLRALAAARGDRQSGMAILEELNLPVEFDDEQDWQDFFGGIAEKFGGFSGPEQASLPSDYQKYLLSQQDPGFGQFLQSQQRPAQEPDAIRTLRILSENPELAEIDAGRRNKPPSGYRSKADGSGEFEPIPGGPADLKIKAQMGKEFEAKKKVFHTLDAEIKNIDDLIGSEDKKKKPHKGLSAMTGYIQSRLPSLLKGQDAQDALSLLESLKSKASINSLREIRSGGSQSIGQITEREWPRLEQMKVALSEAQSEEQFVKQLKEYRDELRLIRRETEMAEIAPPQAPQQQNDGWTDL